MHQSHRDRTSDDGTLDDRAAHTSAPSADESAAMHDGDGAAERDEREERERRFSRRIDCSSQSAEPSWSRGRYR